MTTTTTRRGRLASSLLAVSLTALAVAACKHGEDQSKVYGWSVVDPSERHPIIVSQQPSKLSLRVARGSHGLSPNQRAQLVDFLEKYRAGDAGNSKLVIAAPSGAPNEVAAMQAVAEMRHLMRESGFDESSISVEAYHDDRDVAPPIRVSYLRYVAQGPECGTWPTNLARQKDNLDYHNFGCAQQKNLAAQIANPADLLGPRTQTARPAERRDQAWEKYVKGDSTVAKKTQDERAQVKEK